MSEITPFNGKAVVLVDGDCNFCRRAVAWLRPLISAEIYFYAYQTADLVTHGISIEECEKSVQLIKGNYRSSGATAIADLLTIAGGAYRGIAITVRTLGKVSDLGYEWIAKNRNGQAGEIRALLLPNSDSQKLRGILPDVRIFQGDLCDGSGLAEFFDGAEGARLIHTAGVIHPKRTQEFYAVNRDGTSRLLETAASARVSRAVVVSSNSPCGCNPHPDHLFDESSPYNPYMNYGRSKMEMELRALDLHASGLLLLTNDGRWSRRLSDPQHGVKKQYLVTLKNPLTADYIAAFAAGMHFPFEDILTRPVQLEILDSTLARVTLQEGRYHQIKRMFGRFRNPVLTIHRTAVGTLLLDDTLGPGSWRELSAVEANSAFAADVQT